MAHKVSKIPFSRVLQYVSCPLKAGFDSIADSYITATDLYVSSVKEGIYTYFTEMAMKQQGVVITKKAVEAFIDNWQANSARIPADHASSLMFYQGHYLMTRVSSFFNPAVDKLVACKFPISLSITSDIILEDVIDVLLIRTEGKKLTYRAIFLEGPNEFDNQRYQKLRSAFFKLALQRHVSAKRKLNFLYESRPVLGQDKVLYPEPHSLNVIRKVVTGVAKAIQSEAVYPTTSKDICKACAYNRICEASLVRNL